MIKVTKDLALIPKSLIPAFADLFPERQGTSLVAIPRPSSTTHEKRMAVIGAGVYNESISFNSRYKFSDIKIALKEIYKGKCAFCEQIVEQIHVEHYRPKNIYYWLAYSWDNLILACPTCNEHKGREFAITGNRVVFNNNEANIRNINTSSAGYDRQEFPILVNPEVTDPTGEISFSKDGRIDSNNIRFQFTIETCKLDRRDLNDYRRAILDRFKKYILSAITEHGNDNSKLEEAINTTIRNFVVDSLDKKLDFTAFRFFAVKNRWLNDMVAELA